MVKYFCRDPTDPNGNLALASRARAAAEISQISNAPELDGGVNLFLTLVIYVVA